jgi:hypothetical protein
MTSPRIEKVRTLITERFKGSQISLAAALGKSPAQVYQWLSERRAIGDKLARDIESKLSLPAGWLDGIDPSKDVPAPDFPGKIKIRSLPEIDACQLRAWVDNSEDTHSSLFMVPVMPTDAFGERTFIFEMKDDSMAPQIPQGAKVLVDPDAPCTPGCYVASYQEDGIGICRIYSVPEINEAGEAVVELVPINRTHYPVLKQGRTPFKIVGRIVQSMQVKNYM